MSTSRPSPAVKATALTTRLLILTHHIASRKKLQRIAVFSSTCRVLLKSGKPPGIFLCEFSCALDADRWVEQMRRLRYKDFRVALREDLLVEKQRGGGGLESVVQMGRLREVRESLKDFAALVDACDGPEGMRRAAREEGVGRETLGAWWRRGMGWGKE